MSVTIYSAFKQQDILRELVGDLGTIDIINLTDVEEKFRELYETNIKIFYKPTQDAAEKIKNVLEYNNFASFKQYFPEDKQTKMEFTIFGGFLYKDILVELLTGLATIVKNGNVFNPNIVILFVYTFERARKIATTLDENNFIFLQTGHYIEYNQKIKADRIIMESIPDKDVYELCTSKIYNICAINQDKNLFELLDLIADCPLLNRLSMVEKLDAITQAEMRYKYTHPNIVLLEYTD